MTAEKILIIGGGIGGLTLAIALERLGFSQDSFEVFEKASLLRGDSGSGMSLIGNSLELLQLLGVDLSCCLAQNDVTLRDFEMNVRFRVPLTLDKEITEKFSSVQVNCHRGELV